ncbi:MAG TPA: histidine phosphatase family protein [Thermoanaerobaculia bacterium]|jgi:phosphohistidine phosphatase|nr:histidine phosphatase family protein [Thermoanaerobaculia bacterium]
MKTLLLLRHARAMREPADDDPARPLAPEGEDAAARVGRFLAAAGVVPDALLASPALRARDTLERVAAAAGWEGPRQERPFYETTPAGVLASLRELPGTVEVALAVGHEPTWSDTTSRLIGGGNVRLPTCAVAAVGLDILGWGELAGGRGELLWLVAPKLLPRSGDIAAK